jgi:ABC-type uncharacterized transport system substrate-binding protein
LALNADSEIAANGATILGGCLPRGTLPSIGRCHAIYRQSAFIVDKILMGTKPMQLPGEQPKKLKLLVNTKTAKSLGATCADVLCPR